MRGHRFYREQPSKKPATPRPAISLRTARVAVTGGEVEGAARGGGAALANARGGASGGCGRGEDGGVKVFFSCERGVRGGGNHNLVCAAAALSLCVTRSTCGF